MQRNMKKDIENRNDIEALLNNFYEKVKPDPVIGYIFTDIIKVNWEKHLPVIYDFWESTVLQAGKYSGNPMQLHLRINEQVHLTAAHFKRWTDLFTETVDEMYEGGKAELAKQRALSIATIMQIKMRQ
jgi:hemoglobin